MRWLLLWCFGLCLVPPTARANPRPLPFSYPYATLPKGEAELEQFVDLTWVRSLAETGETVWAPRSVLTTELEYGLSDHAELGLYLQLSENPNTGAGDAGLRFDGLKQRLRVRLGEPDQWPVNVALYAEVAELSNEIELEAKVILERRVGRMVLVTNLWAEHELYFSGRREWVIHPTLGTTYQFSPAFIAGLEYWMNLEIDARDPAWPQTFNPSAQHYLGPTFMVQFSRFWWSTGAYLRLNDFDRSPQFGDQFGRFWVRTVLGVDLPG
jgi:hypothetical protein